jgi:hypothetical protein
LAANDSRRSPLSLVSPLGQKGFYYFIFPFFFFFLTAPGVKYFQEKTIKAVAAARNRLETFRRIEHGNRFLGCLPGKI